MENSEIDEGSPLSYYDKYSAYSDEQIREILKNHKNYQELAATAAIKVAIERALIHSEQDLISPEYQHKRPVGFSIFPIISNDFYYKKVIASIFRLLFLLAFLPIVFGILKYAEGQLNMTFWGIGLGFIWLILTFLLLKTKNKIVLLSQVVILILVLFGLGYWLVTQVKFHFFDLVLLFVGTLLPIYFLVYLKKLIQAKSDLL